MGARAGRRTGRQKAAANHYRHANQPSREQLYRDNERLHRENDELRRQVAEREREIIERAKQIADAEKQIADLERQLALRKQNSTNSSKPPSSDGLAGDQRSRGRKRKSRRKPGAQPGHAGHHRRLVPTTEVSAVEVLLPSQCRHCGGRLPQNSRNVTVQGEPRRHQVTEIPSIEPHITEYQFPNVVCGHCGKTTREPLPNEIAGHFGPQLAALIAYLKRLDQRRQFPQPTDIGSQMLHLENRGHYIVGLRGRRAVAAHGRRDVRDPHPVPGRPGDR